MSDPISKRIDVLMAGPKRVGFNIVYDDANGIWLGRVSATTWSLINEAPDDRKYDIAAEGATPAEVLRKLAEMLE